ncbi:ATP synthase F1 subunit delta, partial [Candidatus Aerophobetes bacterium]
ANFSEVVNNFLRVLVERKRINRVLEITEYYSMLLDEFLGIARAKIITARPIKKKTLDKLIAALEKFTSKKVEAVTEIDSSIIGGVVVKIGNLVLDGSIVAQLEGLKESLKRSGWR